MPSTISRVAWRLTAFIALSGAVAACASKAAGSSTTTAPTRSDRMDTTELRGKGYANLYDAISARHSDWLLARGGPISGGQQPAVGVFIEGQMRPREVSYLRELRPEDVKLIRRLSPTESLASYSWPWGGLVITIGR